MGTLERWTIRENSIVALSFSWSCDIITEDEELEIFQVYAPTKEQCIERAELICTAQEMKAVLQELYYASVILTGGNIARISTNPDLIIKIESLLKDLP